MYQDSAHANKMNTDTDIISNETEEAENRGSYNYVVHEIDANKPYYKNSQNENQSFPKVSL